MSQPTRIVANAPLYVLTKNYNTTLMFPKTSYPKSTLVDILRALFNLGKHLRLITFFDIGFDFGVEIAVHSVRR